ncbi:MAG: MinD/ParA family protein [Mobilicoccus sp.]|nr:MinD/ParA family protein [Mobilicoccus sp.]
MTGPTYGLKPANPQPRPDATRYPGGNRPWRREPEATESTEATAPTSTGASRAEASAASEESIPTGLVTDRPVARETTTQEGRGVTPARDGIEVGDLVRAPRPRPRSGWRSLAFTATGGRWNPGISPREARDRAREAQISTQLRGKHVTAFFCLKGGISKTSTTAATSIALSDLRPDPVFAIDANPDAGDLAERLVGRKLSGIAALARDIDDIGSLEDLSRYTSTRGRLTVLPGEPNPTLGDSLRADDFDAVMRAVQRYYSFIQVDCGTGVTHPLMEGVLRFADTVVIPAAWSITGAKRAAETIDWLTQNGFDELAKSCIVVLTAKDIVSGSVDKDAVLDFLSRAGDVIVVPADPHVADGALLDWESLQPSTREAYLDIAAAITKRFHQAV